ncbi:MAG TPA: 50S ribosomal protein L18 [Patescibacteria group bacterium]|nr:50S ribosomal protein L18 [Patescibacteria group bacterium]
MKKNYNKIKKAALTRRQNRVRAKIFGTATLPRLNVSKSLTGVFLQLIDDESGRTLVSLHSQTLAQKGNKTEVSLATGLALAQKAKDKGITQCVFDRSGHKYHGRIKAVADGARQGGLKF